LNGYNRIRSAFEGTTPDTVPIMLHNFQLAAREAGFTQEKFRNDARCVAEAFIKSVETYRYDGIYVEIDTATLAGALNAEVRFRLDEPALAFRGCLKDWKDIEKCKSVDISGYKYIQVWLASVRLLRDYFKDEIFIRGNCDQAPFSLASMLRGMQKWFLDLYDNDHRDQVFELLEFCADVCSQFVGMMAQAGAHGISNGDSVAGPTMVSPEVYQKFALPFERRVIMKAHEYGLPYILHICGDTTKILDQMPASGADGIELDYLTDARKARAAFKNNVVFSGNIDPSGVLTAGTPDEVKKAVYRLLSEFSGTPKFILCSGCSIPPSAPPENIKAFISAGREFHNRYSELH